MGVKIVYEDNHLLVVDKPAGARTQADSSGEPSLQDQAKADLARRHRKPGNVFLGIVHRLDRPAQGLVLFAKTSKAASRLSREMRERRIEKVYWAVVEGKLRPREGRLEGWLAREGDKTRVARAAASGAQEAALSYRVLRETRSTSLVEIRLETGRKHQIRAQLAALGHPIVGDSKYGARIPYRKDAIALLARRIAFEHPTRKERIVLSIEPPSDWPCLP